MRPNLILMLAFLIFLVGFFSTQITLTGYSTRGSFYSSLTNEELTRLGDLTVEDCRVAGLFSGYDARSHTLYKQETRPYDKRYPFQSKTTYQLGAYDSKYDLFPPNKPDGRITSLDVKFCYDVVNQRGAFATAPSFLRSATVMSTCRTSGERRCSDDRVIVCTPDARENLHWVAVARADKAQECRNGILESLVVFKPKIQRFTS